MVWAIAAIITQIQDQRKGSAEILRSLVKAFAFLFAPTFSGPESDSS
jgi:hypothetical protein